MDKYISQVGDWTCAAYDTLGLEKFKEGGCSTYDERYQGGLWVLSGAIAALVLPAMARSLRDFLMGRDRETSRGQK